MEAVFYIVGLRIPGMLQDLKSGLSDLGDIRAMVIVAVA